MTLSDQYDNTMIWETNMKNL